MAFRTIVVSGRAALRHHPPGDAERRAIQDRIDELLADLEQFVIRDGGNPTILQAIEDERRRLFE